MKQDASFVRSISACALLATALACVGCGSDSTAPINTPPPADVNTYVATLPSWAQFSPPLPDDDTPRGASVDTLETIGNEPYNCSTTPYSLTRTPDRIVTLDPDVEVLWVGSLLQGKGHLGGIGTLKELPIRQRAPLTLAIDLLTENNTRTVESPALGSVNSAIGELIQAAQNAGHTAGSSIFFTQETAYSLVQAALSMGLSASYMGASIKASLSANISDETRTITAYFVQRMFNVSMELPQTPGAMFSSAFTSDILQEQVDRGRIGRDNLPVYISNISYGRILMFSFTSTASLDSVQATISALYNGGQFGGNLSGGLRQVLNTAHIQVVTVGGDAANALALIRENNLGAYFATDAPLTTARPISYTVRNLGDNSIASVSETTNYNLKTCVPAALPVTGSKFQIRITKCTVADLPFIDRCGALPFPLDCRDIELQYTIHVETTVEGVRTPLEWNDNNSPRYVARLQRGEPYVFPDNTTEVSIHYDGRDHVNIWGEIRDYDTLGSNDRLPLGHDFRWPATPMIAGDHYLVAHDNWGNAVNVYITLIKGQDVDD